MGDPFGSGSARITYAIKPRSWPKLLVPAFFGQALGFAIAGAFSIEAAVFGVLYVVTHGLLVVLLNDWSDQRVDALKRTMFPDGCSPKTIADSVLGAGTVLTLGLTSLALCVVVSFVAEEVVGRPGFFVMGLAGIVIFLAYSFPPIRLNYRGGGELLEAFGVGYFLPALEAYLQSGELSSLTSPLYVGTVLLAGSSAIASGLSDERSDAAGGKNTFVTRYGNARGRKAVLALSVAGVLSWLLLAPWSGLHPALVLAAIAVIARAHLRLFRLSPRAVTDAFGAQAELKNTLHRVIWRGTTALGIAFVAQALYAASQS